MKPIKKSEKGQSLVELAVGLVILILLVAGIIDLGRILFYYISMRDAAQEAATYGSVYPTYCLQIEQRARDAMGDPNVDVEVKIDNVSCSTATSSNACSGREIKVTLKKDNYPLTMPLIGTFIGSQSINLNAPITGTILRPACP